MRKRFETQFMLFCLCNVRCVRWCIVITKKDFFLLQIWPFLPDFINLSIQFRSEVITRMRFLSIVSNRSTHLAQSFLVHECVCKILTTRSVEMDTISAISRTFTFGSFKTISWILLIISGVVILFGRNGLGMVSVLVR